jgi:acyl-CoA thioesterase-1
MGSLVRLAFATLTSIVLLGAAPVHAADVSIVAFGASDTKGKGVSAAEAYPAQLQAALAANGVDATVRNAGVNGDTTSAMLARLGVIGAETKIVVFQPGGNDLNHGIAPAETAANLDAILGRLTARGIHVLMFNYAGPVDNAGIAARHGVTYLGGFHVGVGASQHLADGHMNAQGYATLVQKILPSVVSAIRASH